MLAAAGSPIQMSCWQDGCRVYLQAGPGAELASRVAWDINYEQDKVLGEAKQEQAGGWLQCENAAQPGQDLLVHLFHHQPREGRQVSLVP